MGLLFLDHEDSFSANLVAALRALGMAVDVVGVERGACEFPLEFHELFQSCHGVVLGPGPGHPREYPATVAFCQRLLKTASPPPLFGVCLGLQCVAYAAGACVRRVEGTPVHGRRVQMNAEFPLGPAFSRAATKGVLPESVETRVSAQGHVTLHNSLAVPAEDAAFLEQFCILAKAQNVVLAAVSHKFPWLLCQFHPESFGSTAGMPFIEAFVSCASSPKSTAL